MRSFVHYISYTEQKIPSAVMLPHNLRRVRKHSVLCHFLEIRKKACAHMRLYRPAYSHSRCARADAYNAVTGSCVKTALGIASEVAAPWAGNVSTPLE